jgi:phospholipid/cholesterol/gamma-HCH transport system permease protein
MIPVMRLTAAIQRTALLVHQSVSRSFEIAGGFVFLLARTCLETPMFWRAPGRLVRQMMSVGVHTLPLAAMIGVFTGMVVALQTGYELRTFGLQDTIGSIVGLTMVREMGPVITAFLIAGRVGSSMAAELGTMSVTEEIDALRVMGISPVRYLVVPRFLAILITQPLLTVYSVVIGIWGASLISAAYLHVDAVIYFSHVFRSLQTTDIIQGFSKTFVFAAITVIVACHLGMTASSGAAGVGKATTRSVVISLTAILVSDYFVTSFFGVD